MSDDLKTPFDDDPEKREVYLRGAADAIANKPAKLTIADIRKMTPTEIADRMVEVREALKSKPAENTDTGADDGDDA